MFDQLIETIESYSPFVQGLIASITVAISIYLFQVIVQKLKNKGLVFIDAYSKLDVIKHVLHKEYINTQNVHLSTFGATIALLHASRWLLLAILIADFFAAISFIINRDWLLALAAWFVFNCVFEAYRWVRDSSNDKTISHIPEDIKAELYERYKPKQNKDVSKENEQV